MSSDSLLFFMDFIVYVLLYLLLDADNSRFDNNCDPISRDSLYLNTCQYIMLAPGSGNS